MLHIVYGIYRFKPKLLAFRNDYCLSCARPRRSLQIQTFNTFHIFWIPLLPLGIWKRWACAECGRDPHLPPGTRRAFKWVGFFVLLFFAVISWSVGVDPDFVEGTWIFRIGAPLGALLLLLYLLRVPEDLSLKEGLALVHPAAETTCPFCAAQLLAVSGQYSCPRCRVVRY